MERGANMGGIVHTHSTYATSWAQAVKPVPILGTTHADYIQGEIPCTPYISEESIKDNYELGTGNLIVSHFDSLNLNPDETNMTLIGGHGAFTWGNTAKEAISNAVILEEICKMALNTLLISPNKENLPSYIVEKHYFRKHGKNAYYGQVK